MENSNQFNIPAMYFCGYDEIDNKTFFFEIIVAR